MDIETAHPGQPKFFAMVQLRAAADRRLNATDLRALVAVNWHAKGGVFYGAIESVAVTVGTDRRNAHRAMKRLELFHYLSADGFHVAHGRRTRRYRVNYEAPDIGAQCVSQDAHSRTGEGAQRAAVSAAQCVSPDALPSVSADTQLEKEPEIHSDASHRLAARAPDQIERGGKSAPIEAWEREAAKPGNLPTVVTSPTKRAEQPKLPLPQAGAGPTISTPSVKAELYRHGLDLLCAMTLKAPREARTLIGKWMKGVAYDAEAVLAAIQDAREHEVADPVPWITALLKPHRQPTPTAENDPEDAWGIEAAIVRLEGVTTTVAKSTGRVERIYAHKVIDEVMRGVARAAQLSRSWRGSWKPLFGWLADGVQPDDLIRAVEQRARWGGYDPTAVVSIGFFKATASALERKPYVAPKPLEPPPDPMVVRDPTDRHGFRRLAIEDFQAVMKDGVEVFVWRHVTHDEQGRRLVREWNMSDIADRLVAAGNLPPRFECAGHLRNLVVMYKHHPDGIIAGMQRVAAAPGYDPLKINDLGRFREHFRGRLPDTSYEPVARATEMPDTEDLTKLQRHMATILRDAPEDYEAHRAVEKRIASIRRRSAIAQLPPADRDEEVRRQLAALGWSFEDGALIRRPVVEVVAA